MEKERAGPLGVNPFAPVKSPPLPPNGVSADWKVSATFGVLKKLARTVDAAPQATEWAAEGGGAGARSAEQGVWFYAGSIPKTEVRSEVRSGSAGSAS